MLTSLYAIKGGMVSVVITEVMQFMHPDGDLDHHRLHRHLQGLARDGSVRRPRRLVQSFLRLEARPGLDRHPRQGQRRHPAGWQRVLHHHLRPDVLQRRAGQPGRAAAQLRHAARPGHPQPARSLHDERLGQRRALLPPLHDDRGPHDPGPGLLHAAVARHGQAGLRETPADRADAIRARGRGRLLAGRPAGGVHVQFRRHDQRRARLPRQ